MELIRPRARSLLCSHHLSSPQFSSHPLSCLVFVNLFVYPVFCDCSFLNREPYITWHLMPHGAADFTSQVTLPCLVIFLFLHF